MYARRVITFFLICILTLVCTVSTVNAAARSTHIIIKNNTNHRMIGTNIEIKHGKLTSKPPRTIEPGSIGEWGAESNGIATGTEGSVTYRLDGISGTSIFNWDNPFVGSNSANGSGSSGFKIDTIGNKGNRTLVFFSIHDANNPVSVCSAQWVIEHLGEHPENELDAVDKTLGLFSTPLKNLGFGGWVNTGCQASAKGWAVRDAQHSTDGFWTIDVKLQEFKIDGKNIPTNQQKFVRLEVEPNTPAHAKAKVKANQFIQFGGRVLIDTHHGDELIEVHPYDAIMLATEATPYGVDTCKQGFVWREAISSDHVCVLPKTRTRVRLDNAKTNERREPQGGAYGVDTCKQGFVWREAISSDHVCVTPGERAATAEDNRRARERRVNP